jgi:tetrahydromethanopterin S-methyltransferase subunit G
MFSPLESASAEEFEAAVRRLEGLDQQLEEISGWELSIDMDAQTEWKAGLVATFVDEDTMERYVVHPVHAEIAQGIGKVAKIARFAAQI